MCMKYINVAHSNKSYLPLTFAELLAPLLEAVFLLLLGIFFDWLWFCCVVVFVFLLMSCALFPLLVILILTALSSPLLIYAVVLYRVCPDEGFTFSCFDGLFRLWILDPPPLFLAFRDLFVFSNSSSPSSNSTSPLLPEVEFEDVRHCKWMKNN